MDELNSAYMNIFNSGLRKLVDVFFLELFGGEGTSMR